MLDTETIYLTMTGIFVVTGIAWVLNGLSAFSSWRTFRVRADLGWLIAFLILAMVAGSRALEAYRWLGQVQADVLAPSFVELLGDVAIGTLRFAAFEMAAALTTLFAFNARRLSLD